MAIHQIGDKVIINKVEYTCIDNQGTLELSSNLSTNPIVAELEKKADVTEKQPVIISSLPLPDGAATEEGQEAIIEEIGNQSDSTISQLEERKEVDSNELELSVEQLLLKNIDSSERIPFNVKLPIDLKQEADGGLLLADMKGPYIWNSTTATQTFTIDCNGYQSLLVHKITTGVVTPYNSNDGKTLSATLAIAVSTTIPAATILTAAGMYIVPVTGRYIHLVGPASSIQCFIYLSRLSIFPLLNTTMNMTLLNGTAPVNAGVAGTLAIGGNIATGVAPTTNPVQIGGVDDLKIPLTRRILTDSIGRQIIATNTNQIPGTTGINTPLNPLGFLSTYKNILNVQDTATNEEGLDTINLLSMILKELQILNHQMFDLPRVLDEGRKFTDEPESLREEKYN